jgi:hypothetical protein
VGKPCTFSGQCTAPDRFEDHGGDGKAARLPILPIRLSALGLSSASSPSTLDCSLGPRFTGGGVPGVDDHERLIGGPMRAMGSSPPASKTSKRNHVYGFPCSL